VNMGVALALTLAVGFWQNESLTREPLHWLATALLLATTTMGGVLAIRPGSQKLQLVWVAIALACVPTLAAAASGRFDTNFSGPDCALAELAISIAPGAVAALLLRKFWFQKLRTWIGGVAAGAAGVLVLHVTCHIESKTHVLLFHVAPCLAVAAVFFVVRARLPSQTYAP
jgi:hypothetical protein